MIIECTIADIDSLNDMLAHFHVHITPASFLEDPFSVYLAYQSHHEMIAFIHYAVMYERAELNYIYVKTDYRGGKVASLLMEEMIHRCSMKQVQSITLEVRRGNEAAIQLYKKYGFGEISVRKNYYQDEDGIMMEKVLK